MFDRYGTTGPRFLDLDPTKSEFLDSDRDSNPTKAKFLDRSFQLIGLAVKF
jgi:hypothetical protein